MLTSILSSPPALVKSIPVPAGPPLLALAAYLTVGNAARKYGVHTNTIRSWCNQGTLRHSTTSGKHRRILESDLRALLGLDKDCGQTPIVNGGELLAYLRVSGAGQKDDLTRQEEEVVKFCQEKYGRLPILYKEVGSAMNYSRKEFVKLVGEILSNKHNGAIIVINYKDRFCRFAFELLEQITEAHKVRIDIVHRQVEVSSEVEMSEDILSIIHSFSCKQYSLRSALNNSFRLTPEGLALAKELKDSGYTYAYIKGALVRAGHTMSNGRNDKVRPPSIWVIAKELGGELLEQVLPKEEINGDFTGETNWQSFARDRLDLTGKDKDRLSAKVIWGAYSEWCKSTGENPVSKVVVGKWLRVHCLRKYEVRGRAKYVGVKLRGETRTP